MRLEIAPANGHGGMETLVENGGKILDSSFQPGAIHAIDDSADFSFGHGPL